MRALLLISVLAIAAPVRPQREPVPDERPPLAEQILGDWVTVQYIRGGTVDKEAEGTGLKFTRTALEVHEKLDAAKAPASIDILVPYQRGETVRAILKVEGDQLTLCLRDGGGDERPTSFASPPGTNISLVTLRRAPAK